MGLFISISFKLEASSISQQKHWYYLLEGTNCRIRDRDNSVLAF